jgi:hypothetical protein
VDIPASTDKAALQIRPSSNITGFTNATENALIMPTTNFNFGGGTYSGVTGAYTIPSSGVYAIDLNLNMNFVSSVSKEMIIIIRTYVNGTLREQQYRQDGANVSSGFAQNFAYQFHHSLNAGDVLTFRFIPSWGGSTPAPFVNSASTNITVTRVY